MGISGWSGHAYLLAPAKVGGTFLDCPGKPFEPLRRLLKQHAANVGPKQWLLS